MTFSKGELRNTNLLSENQKDNQGVHGLHIKNKREGGREGGMAVMRGRHRCRNEELFIIKRPVFTLTDSNLEGR